ncbi:hypothetical protein, partial [Desulfuromonas acetoxidans]
MRREIQTLILSTAIHLSLGAAVVGLSQLQPAPAQELLISLEGVGFSRAVTTQPKNSAGYAATPSPTPPETKRQPKLQPE